MPPLAIAAIAGAVIGLGAEEIISSTSKSPKQPDTPALPSTDKATQDAQAAQTQQRRTALASGGLTDNTGGSGIILGSDVKTVSLIGG